MRDRTKIIMRCICIILPLMIMVAHAEKTTIANTTDLIEYDVVYTITTTENITTLNAVFTVTNNEAGTVVPLLIAAIYDDGKMMEMQTIQPSITSGSTVNETVSIVIPSNKTEHYYIKLFAWEGSGSLRPLGKYKTVTDIDPYLREKLIYVTASEDAEFKIYMNASTVKGENNEAIHTIKYDVTKVIPIDLCGFTYNKELTAGEISNTNITIQNADLSAGRIEYKFNLEAERNTGITNLVKFKTLSEVTDETIVYTIQ